MSLPQEDKQYNVKSDMLDSIVVLLGGRVAEALVLGDISTGASNDIERATETARSMVTRYGMSDRIGPVSYSSGNHEVFLGRDYSNTKNYSEAVASEIDGEVRAILEDGYARCEKILGEHMELLTVLAEYLIKNEKIDGEDFRKLMNGELKQDEDAAAEAEEAPVPEQTSDSEEPAPKSEEE